MLNKKNSDQVFGNTFKRYSKKEISEFVKPFIIRFKKNNINSKKLFNNKKCLDLGCGNGRGGVFMSMNNAKDITYNDISMINTNKSKSILKMFGKASTVVNSPCEKLNIKDSIYDFVWCNGVIMHTEHPSKALKELHRVLKPGGQSWIYVYGCGGLWWLIINSLRKFLKGISPARTIKELVNLKYSNRYVAEYLDDWKVKNLRKYDNKLFIKALKIIGFEKIKKINRGLGYDTSEKLYLTKDKKIYGNGDLRYLVTKSKKNKKNTKSIKFLDLSHEKKEPKLKKFQDILNSIFYKKKRSLKEKIKLAAKIQFQLRSRTNKKIFLEENFYTFLSKIK